MIWGEEVYKYDYIPMKSITSVQVARILIRERQETDLGQKTPEVRMNLISLCDLLTEIV